MNSPQTTHEALQALRKAKHLFMDALRNDRAIRAVLSALTDENLRQITPTAPQIIASAIGGAVFLGLLIGAVYTIGMMI